MLEVDPNFVKRNPRAPDFFRGHVPEGTFDEFLKNSLDIDLVDTPLSFFQLLLLFNIWVNIKWFDYYYEQVFVALPWGPLFINMMDSQSALDTLATNTLKKDFKTNMLAFFDLDVLIKTRINVDNFIDKGHFNNNLSTLLDVSRNIKNRGEWQFQTPFRNIVWTKNNEDIINNAHMSHIDTFKDLNEHVSLSALEHSYLTIWQDVAQMILVDGFGLCVLVTLVVSDILLFKAGD